MECCEEGLSLPIKYLKNKGVIFERFFSSFYLVNIAQARLMSWDFFLIQRQQDIFDVNAVMNVIVTFTKKRKLKWVNKHWKSIEIIYMSTFLFCTQLPGESHFNRWNSKKSSSDASMNTRNDPRKIEKIPRSLQFFVLRLGQLIFQKINKSPSSAAGGSARNTVVIAVHNL